MRCLLSFVFFLCAAICWAVPAAAEKRVALVIGNSNYRHISSLANPANDAQLMGETLGALGFTLVGGAAQLDLDEAGLRRVVQAFGTQLQGADVGLFFYAGHGIQVRGANYLVPVGADPTKEADVDFQMLDINAVLRQMESAGTPLSLVILDACRNNPFGGRGLRTTAPGLAQIQAPKGTLISFATQPGNVAADGTGSNSPFTLALAQTIRQPGLGLFDAFNAVGLAVERTTGGVQQPWVSSSPIAGTFYFAGPTAAPTAPTPSPSLLTSEAERAWAYTKDTTSVAVLEDFIRKFGNTPYGSMARAQLDELKRAAALPPGGLASDPLSCSEERNAKSITGDRSTSIVFQNNRRYTVRVYWLDYQGQRKLFMELPLASSLVSRRI